MINAEKILDAEENFKLAEVQWANQEPCEYYKYFLKRLLIIIDSTYQSVISFTVSGAKHIYKVLFMSYINYSKLYCCNPMLPNLGNNLSI